MSLPPEQPATLGAGDAAGELERIAPSAPAREGPPAVESAPVLHLDSVALTLRPFRLEVTLACARWPLVLLGPSGAGKTVLLRLLAGLERAESGSLRFGGEEWMRRPEGSGADRRAWTFLPAHRRPLGYCLQDPLLFPHMSVLENVVYPLANQRPRLSGRERAARAYAELERWNAGALAGSRVETLSGGEQARVALARAFVRRPRLVLLDEPFAALDPPAREELLAMVLRESAGSPLVWVTHDRAEALTLGGTMAVVLNGRIEQVGPPEEVFRMPASPEVASFVGVGTVLHGFVQAREAGVMRLRCGAVTLRAAGSLSPGTPVVAAIRSEDVELLLPEGEAPGQAEPAAAGRAGAEPVRSGIRARPSARRTSARNEIAATIAGIRTWGLTCLVDLQAGSDGESVVLSAAITRQSCEELGLVPGSAVLARIKALAVQVRSEAWGAKGSMSGRSQAPAART